MDKYLLNKLTKEQLVDTIIDLTEVKLMLEYSVKLYQGWYKDKVNEYNWMSGLRAQKDKKLDKHQRLLLDIVKTLNNDELEDGKCLDEIFNAIQEENIYEEAGGEFVEEYTDEYKNIYEDEMKKISDEIDKDRERLKAEKIKFNYEDPEARERFRKHNFYRDE